MGKVLPGDLYYANMYLTQSIANMFIFVYMYFYFRQKGGILPSIRSEDNMNEIRWILQKRDVAHQYAFPWLSLTYSKNGSRMINYYCFTKHLSKITSVQAMQQQKSYSMLLCKANPHFFISIS